MLGAEDLLKSKQVPACPYFRKIASANPGFTVPGNPSFKP
jgi:hypothetical protein